MPQLCHSSALALTAALIEPVYQFDPHNLRTTATLTDNTYTLNGEKIYTPLPDCPDTILIYAKDVATETTQGFLVNHDNPGLYDIRPNFSPKNGCATPR